MNFIRAKLPWLVIVGILGLLIGGGATVWAIYNWDDAYVADFNFPINKQSVEKDWVALKGKKSEIQSTQTSGNNSCKYTLYVKQRNGTYESIYQNMTYSGLETASKIYTYDFGNWLDYKFKMKKTTQTSVVSSVKLMVEKPES